MYGGTLMNFDRSLLFSYLEEDNIQRAYFRVRPLLTLQGDIRQEAVQLWPNEGCLRIVPDRNEQHTFKIRMRTLGSYCVVDLRDQPVDAGKIRTNKNFRPDKGEVNQYILYSDTVHALPEHSFYQIVEGTAGDFEAAAKSAITPLFFIRADDTLYGPVRKDQPVQPEPASEAAGMLFELPCPDGVTRMMLCLDDAPAVQPVETAEAAVPADEPAAAKQEETPAEPAAPAEEPAAPTALPIGEKLRILDKSQTHDDTLRQLNKPVSSSANLLSQSAAPAIEPAVKNEPLSGTPLVRTPLRVSIPQAKNHTQEVISNQWSVGKYEPPAQNLPAGTAMRTVDNPVEAACQRLRDAWNASGAHDQLADCFLALDGSRPLLERKICQDNHVTIMQRVLRDRLQDLEAERLTALCELDKAHRDVDAYRQELLTAMSARITRETGTLETARAAAKTQVDALKSEVNALTLQRDALLDKINELQSDHLPEAVARLVAQAQMTAPFNGTPLRLSPVSGTECTLDDLIARLIAVCTACGISLDRNACVAVLVLLAGSPRIGISSPTPAPLATLARNIACAFGWSASYVHQIAAEQRPVCGVRPVDATPAILATSLPNYAPVPGMTKLCMNRNTGNLIRNAAYDVNPWPIMTLPALPFVPELPAEDVTPVSAASITTLMSKQSVSAEELDKVLGPILSAANPLSGAARKELYRFISVCADLMDGGLPSAVDWGITLWIIPALERGSKQFAAVKPLLDEYPLSLAKL